MGSRTTRGWSLADKLDHYSMPEPNSGCLLWAGSWDGKYGTLRWCGKLEKAHRLSWMCHRGQIPSGMLVCHKCDVMLCINERHLWLGTESDNTQDMYDKGRGERAHGERHPMAKLSIRQVRHVRKSPSTNTDLARLYGVSRTAIYAIRKNDNWRNDT